MFKRFICVFISLAMLLSLVACEGEQATYSDGDDTKESAVSTNGFDDSSCAENSETVSSDYSDDSSAYSEAVEDASLEMSGLNSSSFIDESNDVSADNTDSADSSEPELETSDEVSEENSKDVSVEPESSAVSSEDESEDESKAESSEKGDSSFESSEASQSIPTVTEEYPVFSPSVDYEVTYKSNGLILYNTDFRMSESLEAEFLKLFESFPYAQSICMTELSTNMAFAYNPNKRIATASSIKGPFGLYVSKSVDAGRVGWKDPKSYEEKHYQANSSGGIQYFDYGTSFSVKRLLELMIDISDNQAYLMLKDLLGSKKFNFMMEKLGADTIIPSGGNWGNITGWEMLQTWREIYYYKDVNKNGDMLFDLYLEAGYNYIKEALPQYTSAHKSGWSGKAFNDAGIVFNDNVYAMSILLGRKDVYDTGSRVYFIKVAKLLDKLMNEYNAYLDGDSSEDTSTAESSSVESSAESDFEASEDSAAESIGELSEETGDLLEEPDLESSLSSGEDSREDAVVSAESSSAPEASGSADAAEESEAAEPAEALSSEGEALA